MSRRLFAFLASTRIYAAVATSLLVLLLFFVVMSNRTGETQFRAAKRRLDRAELVNLQLNAALSFVLFNMRTDFDQVARLQRRLRDASRQLGAHAPKDGTGKLASLFTAELDRIEDVKSEEAVLRNSRRMAERAIQALKRQSADAANREALYSVESAFLGYTSGFDAQSAARLRAALANVDADFPRLAGMTAWSMLERQVRAMLRQSQRMGTLMQALYSLPLQQTIIAARQGLAARLAAQLRTADGYRTALFAIAILLLAFSVMKAAQVRRYVRVIERSKEQLEERVRERTRRLSEANMTLLREMNERVSMEAQLRIAQKLESIGQLAAGVAHEINTPSQYVNDNIEFLNGAWRDLLTLVDDYARVVRGGSLHPARSRRLVRDVDIEFLREEIPAALEASAAGLKQINSIVAAMRDLSHPGTKDFAPGDVNHAVESAATVARSEWKHVAELKLALDEGLPQVPCDVSALSLVTVNLIVNAAQALGESGGPGLIEVSTRCTPAWVEIRVEDNGPGVPDAIRERIFDPFFTTKDVGKGTGQGLAIAHRVVCQQHGGSLSVERGSGGVGARFVVRLPREGAGSERSEASSGDGPLPLTQAKTA